MEVDKIEKLTNYRWLNLFKILFTRNGKQGEWLFASRSQNPEKTKSIAIPDAVIVVPIHINKEGKRSLVITKEYRFPIGSYEYGFPAGLLDPNEGVEESAKRELFEETGLTLTKTLKVSPALFSSAGLTDETAQYLICECEGEPTKMHLQDSEDIETILMDKVAVINLLNSTELKMSAKMWAIIYGFICGLQNDILG